MKFSLLSKKGLYSLVFLTCLFSACSKTKQNSPTPPNNTGTTPVTTGCKLTTQHTDQTGSQTYQFEYGTDGNPSKITYYSNGVLSITENIHPDTLSYYEAGQTYLYRGTNYDTHFFTKQPNTFLLYTGYTTGTYTANLTYDSKSRLSIIKEGTELGSPVLTFTYDANDNVKDITFSGGYGTGAYTRTYTAIGYDDHPTPYAGIKNSLFLQYDFYFFATEEENPRLLFDHLSPHNVLGFVSHDNATTFSVTETYKYTYNAKGQPEERQAGRGETGQAQTSGFNDSWVYDCK